MHKLSLTRWPASNSSWRGARRLPDRVLLTAVPRGHGN